MTFKKVLFLVILSVLCISVSAQFASFRSLSTAGLIDDDIEAMLAVTEMTYVEGFNIFTNLSNFNNQSEEVFNVSSHNYLVGFKASAAKMLHFGILSASNGNTSTASADSVKSVYIDNNNDEDYDAFNTSASSEGITRATNSSNNYFVFNFGKPEGIKFGISYFNMGEETLIDTFSNVDERDSNMISGDLVRISNIWRSSSSDNLGNNNYISLNGAFSAGKFETALGFYLGFLKSQYSNLVTDSNFEDLDPSDTTSTIQNYSHTVLDTGYVQNGVAWSLKLKTYFRINEDSIEGSGYYSNTSYQKTPYSRDSLHFENNIAPGIVSDQVFTHMDSTTYTDSNTTFTKGYTAWGFGGKYVKKLEKAYFAMGASISQVKTQYGDTLNFEYLVRESYDNGDGLQTAADSTFEGSANYTLEHIENGLNTSFALPVGLEYNFWGPLSGRLGSSTYFVWTNTYTSDKFIAFNPGTSTTTYGNGSSVENLNYASTQRIDWNKTEKAFSRYTYFSYGIGWQISKNVKMDLMAFSDLTSLTNWCISANVKF